MKYINVAYEHILVNNNKILEHGNVYLGSQFFYNNPEFFKVLNLDSSKPIAEIEKEVNIKFPIPLEDYNKLDQKTRYYILNPGYGINTEQIRYRYFHYKDCIRLGLKFIIPIKIDNQLIIDVDIDKLTLPSDLLSELFNGRAKLIIYQDSEGFFFNHQHVKWFNDFAAKFRLDSSNFTVESANFKWPEVTKGYYLTNNEFIHKDTIRYNAKVNSNFMERLWFTNTPIHNVLDRGHHYGIFNQFLYNKLKKRHTKKFLCLQRRLSDVRSVVFYKLHTNSKLSENSLYSLLNPHKSNMDQIKKGIERLKLRDSEVISEWFEKYFDFKNGVSLDRTDQETNWATELNEDLHNSTFLNIVVETHQFPSSELFFSEKTIRPIYAAHPFILFGNPESLKYLKQEGYKTFSDFWDESYDEDIPIQERFDRLFNTLKTLADKPMEELNEWLPNLKPILEHNFNNLMSIKSVHKRNRALAEWTEL